MLVIFILLGISLIIIGFFVINKEKKSLRVIISLLGIALILSFGLLYFFISAPFGRGLFDFSFSVAGNYVLYRNSSEQVFVATAESWAEENPVIPPKVTEIAWDGKFVLAKQLDIGKGSVKHKEENNDSLSHNGPNYWILDTEVPRVYGPLTNREFESLRHSLIIHKALAMKDVYSYK